MTREDMEALICALVTAVFMISLIIIMHSVFGSNENYTEQLNTCAKQHNVYECELIAVPKKGVEHG